MENLFLIQSHHYAVMT